VNDVASRIDAVGSVVILCGAGCRGAVDLLCDLSDRLKAPLVHTASAKELMSYDDPRWLGGLGIVHSEPAYNAALDCDLLLCVSAENLHPHFLEQGTVVQTNEGPLAIARRTPRALSIEGAIRPTLNALLGKVARKSDDGFFRRAMRERLKWDGLLDRLSNPMRSRDKVHPQAVARMVSDIAEDNAVFVFDTGLNTLWSGNGVRQSGRQRIIGSFRNAAPGTALGQANGIQALDRSRQVIALTGDGGFNMLMGEFLTTVQHGLPVKVVIFDNAGFGLAMAEAERIGLRSFRQAIELQNPDYARVRCAGVQCARPCAPGGYAHRSVCLPGTSHR
jgi:pyruvate dehydrogenase (quinone)